MMCQVNKGAVRISIHVQLSSIGRRQALKIYQVTPPLRLCIPEKHSDYPPVLMSLLEIIPIFRQFDVTALAAS